MSARVLVVGLDAAEASWIEAWAREGGLPGFARLSASGSTARLANSLETLPGAIWPELASGVSCGRQGLFYHPRQIHTGEVQPRPVEPQDVDASSYFWSVASRAGRRVAVVDVPQVVPAPDLAGVQVFEWGLHDRNFRIASHPPELLAELVARHGDHPVDSCDRFHGTTEAGYRALREALLEGVRRKTALLLDVLGRESWDLFTCAYGETHCVGHQFWHFFDADHPAHDPAAPADLRAALPDVYAEIDRGLQALLDAAGSGASVVVVASHGMGPKLGGPQLLPHLLEALGTYRRPRPGWRVRLRSALPRGLRDALRSLLPATARRGLLPVVGARPAEMGWTGTRAIPVKNNRCGAIRFNLVGREPTGTVRPGTEERALFEELRTELLDLQDPGSGEPIIARVLAARDVFGPDHHPDLPDMMVVFRSDLGPLESCRSPRVGTIHATTRPRNLPRTGDHTTRSQAWIVAPGCPAGASLPAGNVLDLAPTILELLGIDPPGNLDGRSLLPGAVRSGGGRDLRAFPGSKPRRGPT